MNVAEAVITARPIELGCSQPGSVWLIFATTTDRDAYLTMYGHRYSYVNTYADAQGAGLHAVMERVQGGPGLLVPRLEWLTNGKAVILGRHSWAQPESQQARFGDLNRAERDEAWALVDAR